MTGLFAVFAPRDTAAAKKLVAVLTGVAVAVSVLFAVVMPAQRMSFGATAITIGGPLVVLFLAGTIVTRPEPAGWMWAGFPAIGIVCVVADDLASRDASATGQVFLVFPVLFAGAQLRRHPAFALCGLAIAGDVVVTASQLPGRVAIVNIGYVAAALLAITAVLVYHGARVDDLVTALRQQAAIDPLTGLVTRRVLDNAVDTAVQTVASGDGTALIVVDIDHFKHINDAHGHLAGDVVLQQVSQTLRDCSRASDVVSRMGGDELAVLLPGCSLATATDRAELILARIRALRVDVTEVSMARHHSDTILGLTVSLGIAHLPTHALDVYEFYRVADLSLYRAKRAGRDRLGTPPLEDEPPVELLPAS